jgi:hypothetical protein
LSASAYHKTLADKPPVAPHLNFRRYDVMQRALSDRCPVKTSS